MRHRVRGDDGLAPFFGNGGRDAVVVSDLETERTPRDVEVAVGREAVVVWDLEKERPPGDVGAGGGRARLDPASGDPRPRTTRIDMPLDTGHAPRLPSGKTAQASVPAMTGSLVGADTGWSSA